MDSLLNVRTFLAVCRCGNFSVAAQELHVVPSVVSKRIAQLEKTLGTTLFDRTTRVVTLTPGGQRLQQRAAAIVAEFESLLNGFRDGDVGPEGHLRLLAPTTLTLTVLGPLLNRFLQLHPGITVDLGVSDQTINPVESGHDIGICGRAASYAEVQAIPLVPTARMAVAAPAYVDAHGAPDHPRDLDRHACIVFQAAGTTWRFRGRRGPALAVVRPRLACQDYLTVLDAACRGLGVALLPGYLARASLARGQLVQLLPDFTAQEEWFTAQVPERALQLARVRVLIDWLTQELPGAFDAWARS